MREGFRAFLYHGIKGITKFTQMVTRVIGKERIVLHDGKGVINLFIPPIPSPSFSRYLTSHTTSLVLRKKKVHIGIVLLCTTRRCPYNCWYCSAAHTPLGDMPLEKMVRMIETFKTWGVSIIGLTGGEPLLRFDTDRLIEQYVHDMSFIIFTSGYGLDRARAHGLKKSGLFAVAISLDDFEKKHHDSARGKEGAFETSIAAIENAKNAGLYTIIQTVATNSILQEKRLSQFLCFVRNLGADELLLLEPLATGKLINSNNGSFLSENDHRLLSDLHERSLTDKKLPKIYSFAYIEDAQRFGCGAGVQHAYVDVSGNFWPCNFLPISLGDVIEQPEIVYKRLARYFANPCITCITMKKHRELSQLANGSLPIPFLKAKDFLEEHVRSCHKPHFYEKLKGKKNNEVS